MTITAALFDAGEVLYHRPRRSARLREFRAAVGADRELSAEDERVAWDLKRGSWLGTVSQQAYHEGMLRLWGVVRPEDVRRGLEVWSSVWPDVDMLPGVVETLLRLRGNGIRLGVVTNTLNPTQEKLAWFRQRGMPDDLWSAFSASCELGVVKPDPQIYLHALQGVEAQASDTIFVGHAQVELDGAAAVGLTTVGYNRDDDSVSADIVIEDFSELLEVCQVPRVDVGAGGTV